MGVPMPEYSKALEGLRSTIISVTHDAHAYHPLHVLEHMQQYVSVASNLPNPVLSF